MRSRRTQHTGEIAASKLVRNGLPASFLHADNRASSDMYLRSCNGGSQDVDGKETATLQLQEVVW